MNHKTIIKHKPRSLIKDEGKSFDKGQITSAGGSTASVDNNIFQEWAFQLQNTISFPETRSHSQQNQMISLTEVAVHGLMNLGAEIEARLDKFNNNNLSILRK